MILAIPRQSFVRGCPNSARLARLLACFTVLDLGLVFVGIEKYRHLTRVNAREEANPHCPTLSLGAPQPSQVTPASQKPRQYPLLA